MNIYVGNLPYSATDSELRDLFGQFGAVSKTNVISDRDTGRSKGFGFVEMENAEDGERAIRELDGNDLDGRNLKVNEARPRASKNSKSLFFKQTSYLSFLFVPTNSLTFYVRIQGKQVEGSWFFLWLRAT